MKIVFIFFNSYFGKNYVCSIVLCIVFPEIELVDESFHFDFGEKYTKNP